ncbi:MAG TPA: histidine kinase [Longimicrobiaceae bacterium]|nr:histidine kinase [Longimicrobiaceae bacterium]
MLQTRTLPLYRTFQVGSWLLFGAAMSVGRIGELAFGEVVALDWSLAVLGFGTTLVLGTLYRGVRVSQTSLARIMGVSLLASYVGGLAWTWVYHGFLATAGPALASRLGGDPAQVEYHGPLLDDTVYRAIILLSWSMVYFGIRYFQALQEERERRLRAEVQAQRAQLRALRYQLNPHFLFNTMNAISTLVGEERNREARSMIARLSAFLRSTLEGIDAPVIPLAEEVEFVRRYLEIEQARFGDRLRVRVDVADDLLSAPVPALVLQPLVENAVRHAVAPREDGALVVIGARRVRGDLLLSVADDGPGLAAGGDGAGTGIGLANTRERLRELYGPGGALTLEVPASGGVRAVIRIPLDESPRRDGRGAEAVRR